MLKSLLTAFLLISNAYAFDYKMNIESRIDLKHQKKNTKNIDNSSVDDKSNSFEGSLVRINFMGNINEHLTYRLRYRVNVNDTDKSRDKTTSTLDHAYVDHKNRFFTTRLGKTFLSESYGRESMISSTDLFLRTQAYNNYNKFIGTYKIGLTGFYTTEDNQKLSISVFNPNPNFTDTTNSKNNSSLGYGIFYSGKFFSNLLQPVFGFSFAPQDGDKDATTPKTDADYYLLAIGFKSQITDDFSLDIDWKEMKKEKSETAATADDGKTQSLFTLANYNIKEITPFIGYVHDKFNADLTTEKFKRHSYLAGAKWKPFNDLNFHYHLFYTLAKTEYEQRLTGIKSQKDQIFGFGFKADI